MSNPLIDVEIYVNSFKHSLEEMYTNDTAILKEHDINDVDRFLGIMTEAIENQATENFYDKDDPTLSETQFIDILQQSIVQYHLDSLIESGLVASTFDEETMQTKFCITDKGRDYVNKFNDTNFYEFSKS